MSIWWVLPLETVHAITYAAGWSACAINVSKVAPSGLESTMQGVFQGLWTGVGAGLGSLLGKLGFIWFYVVEFQFHFINQQRAVK